MEGGSYTSAVLLLAYKTCIQNYLEKILNSSLSPPVSCFPTHPVSVKQDLGKYFGYSFRHLTLVWFRRWKSLSPQHIHRQSHTWNLKQPMIQLFVCVCFRHRGHMKPFPSLCSEQRLRTSPADVLPSGKEKTPGTLQGKNCIGSGSGRGHLGGVSQFCWQDWLCFGLNLTTIRKRRSKADFLGMGNIFISVSAQEVTT